MALSRKQLFGFHNTLGLACAVGILVASLTGIGLTFRSQLRPATPVAAPVAEPLSLDALVKRASEAVGGARVTRVYLPSKPTKPYRMRLADNARTELWLDGAGKVLERRTRTQGLTQLLFLIHTGELLSWPGQVLMVLTALGMCALTLSGFGMWRRRTRRPA